MRLQNGLLQPAGAAARLHHIEVGAQPCFFLIFFCNVLLKRRNILLFYKRDRAPAKTVLTATVLQAGQAEGDDSVLFEQVRIDKAALARHIRQSLQARAQISLGELLQVRPLQQGLGELVAYLQLASGAAPSVVDEAVQETVDWTSADGTPRSATLPRILFVRP